MNTVSKKVSCNDHPSWIKSVAHHFWWACSTCEGDAQILREKWLSIIFHVQNIDHWTGFTKFHMCCHAPLSTKKQRKKNWQSPTLESFKALQDIVFSNSILKDLSYLTKFSHTGTLEVDHSLYNRWLPKNILDINSGSNLNQATTKEGKKRYNTSVTKTTATWLVKSIKEKKSDELFQKLIFRTFALLPIPEIPTL